MQEIKIRSIPVFLAICIFGAVACVGSTLITTGAISISIPILIIGTMLCYLVINMLSYPKANVIQLLKLSLISLAIFSVIITASFVVSNLINHNAVIINSNLTLTATPFYALAGVIFGILSSIMLIRMKKIKIPHQSASDNTNNENEKKVNESAKSFENEEQEPLPVKLQTDPVITVNENIIKPENQTVPDISGKSELIKEDYLEASRESLDPLPEIKLEEASPVETAKETRKNIVYDESIFNTESDDIPDNIRLVNNKTKKIENEKGGIASIGKLLINNRDIENLIEINELMQQIGCNNDDIDVISMSTGIKIYEKFNKVMVDYTQIKDLTLSNKAGFVIASTINNNRRSETVGAISSSAFIVLKNYLKRLEINKLQKIFFETQDNIYSIFTVSEDILSFITEKSFEPVNYTGLKDILDHDSLSVQDLSALKCAKEIAELAITDKKGSLIGSLNSENPKQLASLSSAIFENLKIFIINIQPSVEIKKITMFADEKVYTIRKYNDKIIGLITSPNGPIQLSNRLLEVDMLIK